MNQMGEKDARCLTIGKGSASQSSPGQQYYAKNECLEPAKKRIRSIVCSCGTSQKDANGLQIINYDSFPARYRNQKEASNLWKYYNKHYKESSTSVQATLTRDGRMTELQPLQNEIAESNTQHLLATIVDASLPFSIVDNTQFLTLVKLIQPRYAVFSRRTIYRRVMATFRKTKSQMQQIVFATMGMKFVITVG